MMIMEMQNDDREDSESDNNSYVQAGVCVISIKYCENNDPFDQRTKSPNFSLSVHFQGKTDLLNTLKLGSYMLLI